MAEAPSAECRSDRLGFYRDLEGGPSFHPKIAPPLGRRSQPRIEKVIVRGVTLLYTRIDRHSIPVAGATAAELTRRFGFFSSTVGQ
jgi:hypothetical protein